jgi:hypothetical protein
MGGLCLLLEVPSLPNANIQADWAEASCLFGSDTSISRAEFEIALTESGLENSELITNNIWAEVEWRRDVLPQHYPFNVHYGRIEKRTCWKNVLPYSFMLLLATNFFHENTMIRQKKRRIPAKLFERIACIAVKRYLKQSVNIGSPREGRMPRSFKQAVQLFCGLCNEVMRPKPEFSHYAKDEGVDVIGWTSIDDRAGQLILLTQCTIEKNWSESTEKIDLDTWSNIVNFTAKPQKALAFPYVCHSQWKNLSTKGGILLDRLRLVSLFPMTSTIYLRKKIIDWSTIQIGSLKWFD